MRRQPAEHVRLRVRRHGVVLVLPFAKALVLSAAGVFVVSRGGLLAVLGAPLVAAGALVALRAAWRWERTRLIVTERRLLLVRGTVRRLVVAVPLQAIALEQTALGRMFGYGTLVAGELEVRHVPRPQDVVRMVG